MRPYLYPVLTGDGFGLTRNWPMRKDIGGETDDHPHHKGIYTAHGEVNGIDNWSEGEGHGRQEHRGFDSVWSGSVAGGFTENLVRTDSDKNAVMTETRRVTFYSMPAEARLFDYDVVLHATHGLVTLGDTKEGGLLSVRVASSMDAGKEGGGRILNAAGGAQENETWGKRAEWCDYSDPAGESGRAGAEWYGLCAMDYPENPRHPTYWHVRGYGLMTANCFGVHHFTGDENDRHPMTIPAGESAEWKYRVFIHRGNLSAALPCLMIHRIIVVSSAAPASMVRPSKISSFLRLKPSAK